MNPRTPDLIINSRDAERLGSLLERLDGSEPTIGQLQDELARACLLPPERIPPQVVTMRSVVRFYLSTAGRELELRLVYPRELQDPAQEVSVLSPVGAALLGLSAGDSIDWLLPDGREARITVTAVLFQPEAAGQYER